MSSNLIDITTIVAVESLFKDGPRDPWAKLIAGRLADLFVYSDTLRYVFPMPAALPAEQYPGRPSLLTELEDKCGGVVAHEKYPTDHTPLLNDGYLLSVFDDFHIWARNNQLRLAQWSRLHSMPWVKDGHTSRVGRQYVFNVERLEANRPLMRLAEAMKIDTHQLLYAFDVVLRFPLYGLLAGEENYFVYHPIRNAFRLPGSRIEPAPTPSVCVSFQKAVGDMADRLSQNEYIQLLLDLRTIARDQGLHLLKPSDAEPQAVRAIAQKVKLTPYLKTMSKKAAVVGGIIGGFGAIPILGPAAAIMGGAVSISASVWSGRLPRPVAQWKWLQWTLRWKVESEIDGSQE
jgi:hypothetical protein